MSKHSFGRVYLLYDFIERYIFREYLHEIKLIKNSLDLSKYQNVVDIGGGTGFIAKSIVENVNSIIIVDFSKKMLMQLKNPKIKTIQGDASSIPIKDEVFDIALLINVIHHIKRTEHDNVLAETYRILKKEGKVMIIDKFFPNNFFNKLFNKFEEIATGKTYHISDTEFSNKLKKIGFQNISSSFQDWQNMKYLIIANK